MKIHRYLFSALLLSTPAVLAAPGDFNAIAGYGTEIAHLKNDGNAVTLESLSVVSETTEGDGRKRLSFSGSLRNAGISYYEGAQIRFEPPGVGWEVQIVDDDAILPDLPPNSAAVPLPEPIVLLAPAATAEAVKTEVLSGQRLVPRARELWQFRLPAVAMDNATEDLYSHAVAVPLTPYVKLVFNSSTPLLTALQPGTLVMESTAGDTMDRSYSGSGQLRGLAFFISCAERYTDDSIGTIRTTRMVEVISKSVEGAAVHLTCRPHGGELHPFVFPPSFEAVQTDARFRGFIDNLRVGTEVLNQSSAFDGAARNPTDPPFGNTVFGSAEQQAREDALRALKLVGAVRHPDMADLNGLFSTHIPINGLSFGNGLSLDGAMLLQGMNIDIKVIHRPNLPPKFCLRLTSKVEFNVRLTAGPGANNTAAGLLEKEKQIASIPGPPLFIPIGNLPVKLQPFFSLKVGLNIGVPMDVVIPFQASFEAGLQFCWDETQPQGQRVTFEPVSIIKPLGLSKPQLADSLGFTAELWAEGGASLIVNDLIGPYAGLRASETFTANPLSDPWWNLEANLAVFGGFEIRVLGFSFAKVTAPLIPRVRLPARNGNGLPTAGSGVPGGLPPGPMDPVEGGNARWARLLRWADDPSPSGGILEKVRGSAEDFFMALPSSLDVRPPIMRVGPRGDVIWSTGAQLANPAKLAGTADGGVVVLSHYNQSLLLTRLDGAGQVLWTNSVRPTEPNGDAMYFQAGGLVVRDLTGGQIEVFIGGEQNNNLSSLDADPYLMKFDNAGALQWSKTFPTPARVEIVKDMILLRDGNLLLAGESKGNPDGSPPAAGSPVGGWLMKVTPAGDVLWSRRSMAAVFWSCVTEGPDGKLYTGGNVFPFITVDTPSFAVAVHGPDGQPSIIANIGEAMANDNAAANNPSPPNPITDHVPHAGLTPFDRATDIAWTPSGIALCGTTGLGDQRAPFTMMLTEKLSARWMVTHEGAAFEDIPFSIMPTEEGLVQLGSTRSFGSLGNGAVGITQLMKLPYDGTVALRPATRAIIKYLQPSVYNFIAGQWTINIPSPEWRYRGNESVTHGTATLTTVPGNLPGPYTPIANITATRLDRGSPSAPMSYPEWADYHQLTLLAAAGNSDGDARTNFEEYLFGGNPLRADAMTPPTLQIRRKPAGGYFLDAVRSLAARRQIISLQLSDNPATPSWQNSTSNWIPLGTDPDAGTELICIEVPESAPTGFYRLRYALPAP